MEIIWLGQAGLMFKTGDTTVLVDPYLSNSVEKIDPPKKRRVAVDKSFLSVKPNIIVLTHNHLDHTDPETLKNYINENSSVLVLAPQNAWQTVRNNFNTGNNNFVLFNRKTEWTENNIKFSAVKAEHSDEYAIGFIMEAEGKRNYITGDTLFNEKIFEDLPNKIDYVFLPVNGEGNNMNMVDAKRFCERINAVAVPLHCGLFDNIDMNNFDFSNKVVPKIYKRIDI